MKLFYLFTLEMNSFFWILLQSIVDELLVIIVFILSAMGWFEIFMWMNVHNVQNVISFVNISLFKIYISIKGI